MRIVGRSKAIGASLIVSRPVLTVLLGTTASATFAASPAPVHASPYDEPSPLAGRTLRVSAVLSPQVTIRANTSIGSIDAFAFGSSGLPSRSKIRSPRVSLSGKGRGPGARLRKPTAGTALGALVPQSRASNLSVTDRGIEFVTPALVNGALAGSAPLLIADGRNISIRLADVLALLKPLMGKAGYDALRGAKRANDFVTLETLRAAGIAARMDSQDQLVLGAKASPLSPTRETGEEATGSGISLAGPIDLGFYSDNLTESPDGGTLANTTSLTMRADVTVMRWNLSVDAAYKVARGMMPSAAEQQRSGLASTSRRAAFYRTAGMTDLRISAERSVPLVGRFKLDLLARATLPTGTRGVQRARGRYEMLIDAGISTRVAKADVWAGTGRRFRTQGFYTTGRDIAEFYAGAERPVGRDTKVRADLLLAQSPWRGEPREYSIAGTVSREMRSGAIVDLTVQAYRDVYGKGFQAGLTMRMPMRSL